MCGIVSMNAILTKGWPSGKGIVPLAQFPSFLCNSGTQIGWVIKEGHRSQHLLACKANAAQQRGPLFSSHRLAYNRCCSVVAKVGDDHDLHHRSHSLSRFVVPATVQSGSACGHHRCLATLLQPPGNSAVLRICN